MAQAPVATAEGGGHLQGLDQGFAGATPGKGPQKDGQRILVLLQDLVKLLLALNLQHLPRVLLSRCVLHRGPPQTVMAAPLKLR